MTDANVATGVARSVLRQVEYYFSDSNFPKDKFLMAEVAKSDEGWVNLTVIAAFNKIKGLVPDQDLAVIADALRLSNILEVSEDGNSVRKPGTVKKVVSLGGMDFSSRDEVVTYARGLIAEGDAAEGGAIGAEGQAFVTDVLKLHDKADEKMGSGIKHIKVGRNPDFPDTSCFVIVRKDDTEVDFSYIKCLNKVFPLPPRAEGRSPASGKKRKDGGGSDRNVRQKTDAGSSSEAGAAEGGSGKGGEPGEVQYEVGKIVVCKELPGGFDRFSLAEKFGGKDGGCAFVEMVPDVPLAYVRFQDAAAAKAALAVEGVGQVAVLEGEDEKQYWDKIASGGGGRGSGGKGGGRGGGKGGRGKGKGKGKGKRGKGGGGGGRGGGGGD